MARRREEMAGTPTVGILIHPFVQPLSYLLGTWRGEGEGSFPTISPFKYNEELQFFHSPNKPVIAYSSKTWKLGSGEAMHSESGYWRPKPDGIIEVVIAQSTGLVEVQKGTYDSENRSVQLKSTLVGNASKVKEINRVFKLVNGDISYEVEMATNLTSLQTHLKALLKKVQESQNISRNLFNNVQQTNPPLKSNWCVKEDVALMSSWCFICKDRVHNKNKKGPSIWRRVHEMFQEARAESPEDIKERTVDMLKGRFKRLNESVNKWIAACNEAHTRKKSRMSQKDIEKEAHILYEASGNKFTDLIVFNEVMSKHPKWELKLDHDSTRFCPENEEGNEESGGSSKRAKIREDCEYSVPSNPETPNSRCSTIARPSDKDKMKNKEKGNTSQSFATNEVVAEIHALRSTRDNEVEVMQKLRNAKIELERDKLQRNQMRMKEVMLNTLLAKDHLSPEDEELKRKLMTIVFGQ